MKIEHLETVTKLARQLDKGRVLLEQYFSFSEDQEITLFHDICTEEELVSMGSFRVKDIREMIKKNIASIEDQLKALGVTV